MATPSPFALLLPARAAVYQLLRTPFAVEPDEAFVRAVADPSTAAVFDGFWNAADESLAAPGRAAMAAWQRAADDLLTDEEALRQVAGAFCPLFVGPGPLAAPPWESVYGNGDQTLFQASTLAVRRAYVAHQLIPRTYPHEADDSLALELDFLAALGERMTEAWERGETGEALSAARSSVQFLDEHLLRWIGPFHTKLSQTVRGLFYRETAAVIETFATADRSLLASLADAAGAPATEVA